MINRYSGFRPLKEVWLGEIYPEKFYDIYGAQPSDLFNKIDYWSNRGNNGIYRY